MIKVVVDTNVIVSGDEHHIQPLKEYQRIKILSPASFLDSIKIETFEIIPSSEADFMSRNLYNLLKL